MATEAKKEIELEVAHVLFIDTVGYSKFLIDDQRKLIDTLKQVVRGTNEFRSAEGAGKLIKIATGDGMALVFYNRPEAPVECALQITQALKEHPELRLRMGVHTGPVSGVIDVNERANVAGAGINVARRVMDCGDAGHILLSQHVADDLEQYGRWRPHLHDLGECEVKHGLRLHIFNLAKENLGNPQLPQKFRRGRRPRWKKVTWTIIFLGVAIAVGLFITQWLSVSRIDNSIAVLPFLNLSPNKDQEYFSDGITEQITTSLAEIHGFFVVARTSAFAFKNKTEDVRTIGRQLHVQHVLEGSVSRSPDKLRVAVQLINTSNGYHTWSKTYDSDERDILSLQSDVAQKVASALRVELHVAETKRLQRAAAPNPEAYDLYLRGRYLLNKRTVDSLQKGRALFEQAIAKDRQFAMGHVGIADAYILLGAYGAISSVEASKKAWPEVSSALGIDNDLPDAHCSRAQLLSEFEWNWRDGGTEFRKAIELNPNSVKAHHWYAFHLSELGRSDEAMQEINAAQKQDPLSPIIYVAKGKISWMAHRDDEAIEQCRKALDLEPTFGPAFFIMAHAYTDRRQYLQAIDAARKYMEIAGDNPPDLLLAYVYAAAGNKAESEKIVRQQTAHTAGFSFYDMASICAAWHNNADALQWLERAIDERSLEIAWIRVDPRIDSLRAEPSFHRLAARVISPR